jgi:uncharacterized protein YbaP (TraB family)
MIGQYLGFRFVILVTVVLLNLSVAEAQLLYKVEDVNRPNSKPSYLFGTIHQLCEGQWDLSETIKDNIVACNQMVVELDVNHDQNMKKLALKLTKPADSSLDVLLAKDEFELCKIYFRDSLQLPLQFLLRIRPVLLFALVEERRLGCKVIAVDNKLIEFAKAKKIEIIELETVEEQVSVLTNGSLKDEAYALFEAITMRDTTSKLATKLQDVWLSQDEEAIKNRVFRDFSSSNKLSYHLFLTNRNNKWMRRIMKIINREAVFIAVGAAHLVGEEGLVNLLRKNGFKVSQQSLK